MKSKHFVLVALTLLLSAAACEEKGDPNKETLVRGTSSVYCDAEVAALIQPLLERFQALHATAKLQISTGDARSAMEQLLAGKTRLAVVARDYLSDEDSLMKAYHVAPHRRFHLATDALVFFCQKGFEVDSLSVEALQAAFSHGTSIQHRIKGLSFEPQFVAPSAQSSVVGNLRQYCAANKNISPKALLRYHSGIDSVKAIVAGNAQTIGIGYFSQLVDETNRFKILRLRHYDKDSNRVSELVEQSAVYRELYPFPVKLWGYLLEDLQNFPMGVVSYLAFEPEPQKSFLNKGIVPAYARIKLYEEQ